MKNEQLDADFFHQQNTDLTRRLRLQGKRLRHLLQGAHHQSEGENLEHLVREQIRQHLPGRYRVSSGFLAVVGPDDLRNPDPNSLARKVSSQYDVLIWDTQDHPALFEVGDFAVVLPTSCVAILEVTATLDKAKVLKDMAKLDDLCRMYNRPQRMPPYPYVALVAFEGQSLKTTMHHLEWFYAHRSDLPSPLRYQLARQGGLPSPRERLPFFLDAVCILDQGFLRGDFDFKSSPYTVLYEAFEHEDDIEDALGLLQREIAYWLARRTSPDGLPANADIPREFAFNPHRAPDFTVWIDDWHNLFPGRNVFETTSSNSPASFDGYPSVFAPVDHRESNPMMYVDELPGVSRTLERLDAETWAVGAWKDGERTGKWRVVREREDGGYGVATLWVQDGRLYDANPNDDKADNDPEEIGSHDEFRAVVLAALDED